VQQGEGQSRDKIHDVKSMPKNALFYHWPAGYWTIAPEKIAVRFTLTPLVANFLWWKKFW
jgi:hypothetical protein